jgi:Zn-finger nucleic acid-binding protein
MSGNISDDMTAEVTCPSCIKKFVINTSEIGEMTICPHCNTVMIAQLEDNDAFDQKDELPPV